MLKNYVCETSNSPGTATTINLAGAVADRVTFASAFTTGSLVYYFMDDGSQAEAGYGTFTTGSPNTLSRSTVLWNSSVGETSPGRLNFTSTTNVYCTVPASRMPFYDSTNTLVTTNRSINTGTGTITTAGVASSGRIQAANATGSTDLVALGQFTSGSGWLKIPGGFIFQWGFTATGTSGVQTFPITFPNGVGTVMLTSTGNTQGWLASFNTAGFSWGAATSSALQFLSIGN